MIIGLISYKYIDEKYYIFNELNYNYFNEIHFFFMFFLLLPFFLIFIIIVPLLIYKIVKNLSNKNKMN